MDKEKILKEEFTNDFVVRLVLRRKDIDGQHSEFNTLFGVEKEEDNILYFYYHVLDLALGMIDGSMSLYNLPKINLKELENHPYRYHAKELIFEYRKNILKELQDYEMFKNVFK